MATVPVTQITERAYVRKAADCLVKLTQPAGEAHRAAHSSVVDYRLQEVTADMARGTATVAGFCADKAGFRSPWHYHDCDLQIDIVLDGSADFAFSEGIYGRVKKGDLTFIPGHVVHDVGQPSSDYQVAEFTFPGPFATIEAPAPARGAPTPGRLWGTTDAVRGADARGLIAYAYPIPQSHSARYWIAHERRSRLNAFEPGSLRHENRFQLIFVTQGSREISIAGEVSKLGVGDLLVLPQSTECQDLAASDDHEALRIHMLA